jgi:type I restriction enzyme, S subunit
MTSPLASGSAPSATDLGRLAPAGLLNGPDAPAGRSDVVELATLGSILASAEVFTDGDWVESKDQDPKGDVRLIQLADVGVGTFIDKSDRSVTSTTAQRLHCTFLKPGDVLVARMPDPIGRACLFPRLDQPCITVVDVCVIRPNPHEVDAAWLVHVLNAPASRHQVLAMASGTTRSRISRKNLEKIRIPLPSLPEQQRVADVLDRVEALRAKRRAAIARLDALTQSIFLDMFGDPIANPKGWPEGRHLGDVADIVSGITKGRKLNGAATREVPYLAVVNVQDRRLDLRMVKTIEATEAEVERYRLLEGDLVLTEGGDPDKLGRGALWAEEIPECIHQNHIFRVRLVDADLTPVYLNWLVGSQRGKRYFLKSAKQTTGIATINQQQLRAFPLLIPPLSLQNEFAAAMDRLAVLREQMKASLQSFDRCFASLQHRAFRGEL